MFVRRRAHNETRHISVQTHKGTEGKALQKPDVCEAKCALHDMTNISVQTSKETEGKALPKTDVCEAKYAKQYVASKSVQIEKETDGKHCRNLAFERASTQSYKQLLNQI